MISRDGDDPELEKDESISAPSQPDPLNHSEISVAGPSNPAAEFLLQALKSIVPKCE